MKAATVQIFEGAGKPLRLQQQRLPDHLGHREVLVRISLATICGSDLHTFGGHRQTPTPCILGHEAVGQVIQTGPGRPELLPGDRVTWSIADSCGTCPACTQFGLPEKCESVFKYGHAAMSDGTGLNGSYASHVLLRAGTHIVKVTDRLSDALVAPANCALATMVNAIARVPKNCRVAVIQGAGLLGLYGCALLRERGVSRIFCVDVSPDRLARVSQFGGIPVDGRPENYAQQREEILKSAPRGVDAVLEVAGVAALVKEGIRLLRPGGIYELVGLVHPDSQLNVTGEEIIRKCLTLHGTHNYAPWHLDEAVAFLERTRDLYPYETLVSPPFLLADLPNAFTEAGARHWPRVSVRA